MTKQSIQHISCSSDNEFKQVTQLILSYLGKTLNSRQIFHLNCKIFMFDPIKRMLNMQEANSERSAVHCYSATYLDPQSDMLAMFDKMFYNVQNGDWNIP